MKPTRALVGVLALTVTTLAQQPVSFEKTEKPTFSAPVPLTSEGDGFSKLIYPSPRLHDIDRDGKRELVLGDLIGNVWVCEPTDKPLHWSKRTHVQAGGKPLRLHNW